MASAAPKHELVEVTVGLTDEESGETQATTLEIPGGPTAVPELKDELGIEGAQALWVVEKNGKKKALADHETHNVKAGDHYEAIVKGGRQLMEPAERAEIAARLGRAFGEAVDASPTATHDLHVLFPALGLPPPWTPSPTRALAIFTNWPAQRPLFFVDPTLVGEGGEPPRSNHDAYHLDQAWRGFSWTEVPARGDPVRAIQLWINRFVQEKT